MSTNAPTADSLTPRTAADLANALRDASASDCAVIPWGAGRLQHLGAAPPQGIVLHTTALDQLVDYVPADLTITVEAGMSLGALQAVLRQHGQWLPWHPPTTSDATVGGLLAAGASNMLRLGYGTPRDWVLGMRVALGDGRLVKSGGKVVKNVAGYETHKLHIGALGTLGVIVEMTFKVVPLPERIASLICSCPTRSTAAALSDLWRARPLAPASLVLLNHTFALPSEHENSKDISHYRAVQFAGTPSAVERQLHAATMAARASDATVVDLEDAQQRAFWEGVGTFATPTLRRSARTSDSSTDSELIIRAGARPSALSTVLDALEQHAPPTEGLVHTIGYGGVGLAYARWPIDIPTATAPVAQALAALRTALAEEEGYAMLESAPADLRSHLDLWGTPPQTLALMQALKAQWDPRGILNPGRYAGGI